MPGRTSKWISAVAMMVPLAVAAYPATAACTLQKYASVDVEVDDSGTVMIPVKVNGQEVWMILGLASGLPTAWPEAARQLGLNTRVWSTGEIRHEGKGMQTLVVDSLMVGNVNFGRSELTARSDAEGGGRSFHGKPVLGELGSKMLTAVDMELDLGHGKVNLFKHASCGGDQVYWAHDAARMKIYFDEGGLMVFPLEVDGKRVEAALNTESPYSMINEAVTTRFFGFGRDSQGTTHEAEAGGDTARYRSMSLTAKGLSMKNVKIRLQDAFKGSCQPTEVERHSRAIGFEDCFNVAPLSIGTDILKNLRIYIASGEGNIYFTPAAAPGPADASDPAVPPAR